MRVNICEVRNVEHPAISDKESLDMTNRGDVFICPVCREECERVYYKIGDPEDIIGCDNCVEYMDSMDYRYEVR